MAQELEVRLAQEMRNVALAPGEEVVGANDIIAARNEPAGSEALGFGPP